MGVELVIMPVHGMGDTRPEFDADLRASLNKRLSASQKRKIHWEPIYYQGVLQRHQSDMMDRMRESADIDWIWLREFMLFGFSDAASMEAKPHLPRSVYQQVQEQVVAALDRAWSAAGEKSVPIILVAHSLGCQVISNYIWDAQVREPCGGVFCKNHGDYIRGRSAQDKFRRFKSARYLITTGCNIPIFIAGIPEHRIKPIIVDQRGWQIHWSNYYDPDDVLGWPLRPVCESYGKAVAAESAINSGGLTSGTPLSHGEYWGDGDFLRPLVKTIGRLIDK